MKGLGLENTYPNVKDRKVICSEKGISLFSSYL